MQKSNEKVFEIMMFTWTCCITNRSQIFSEPSSMRFTTSLGSMTAYVRARLVSWSLAESATITCLPSSAVEKADFHS